VVLDEYAGCLVSGNHEPQSYLSFLQSADQLRQEHPVLTNPWAEAAKEGFKEGYNLPTASISPSPRFSNPVALNNLMELPRSPFTPDEAGPSHAPPAGVHSSQLLQVAPLHGHYYGGPRQSRLHNYSSARLGRGEALESLGPSFMSPQFFTEASLKDLMQVCSPFRCKFLLLLHSLAVLMKWRCGFSSVCVPASFSSS
jgi:hypothetical protein